MINKVTMALTIIKQKVFKFESSKNSEMPHSIDLAFILKLLLQNCIKNNKHYIVIVQFPKLNIVIS